MGVVLFRVQILADCGFLITSTTSSGKLVRLTPVFWEKFSNFYMLHLHQPCLVERNLVS